MLQSVKGIVLRSVKYGDSSLVTTIFTDIFGVQAYMVQGVRSAKPSKSRAGFFQPGVLLDLVVYRQANKNMQRIREFQATYIYNSVHEDVVKNSVAMFSVELLLRLLPEEAPMPELFEMASGYFIQLDKAPQHSIANFPLFFAIECGRKLGYELHGTYGASTPYLDLAEGRFTDHAPALGNPLHAEDTKALSALLQIGNLGECSTVELNSAMRTRLLDWYIAFLQQHTQHMGNIRSLAVLRAVLHQG